LLSKLKHLIGEHVMRNVDLEVFSPELDPEHAWSLRHGVAVKERIEDVANLRAWFEGRINEALCFAISVSENNKEITTRVGEPV